MYVDSKRTHHTVAILVCSGERVFRVDNRLHLLISLEEPIAVVSCMILQLMNVLVFCTNNCI